MVARALSADAAGAAGLFAADAAGLFAANAAGTDVDRSSVLMVESNAFLFSKILSNLINI
jgi:hypothetical protein